VNAPGMTTVSWTLLGIAGLAAITDWVAVGLRARRVEYGAKPLVVVLLVGVAVALTPISPLRRDYTITALAFSLAGDVLLMLPEPDPVEQARARARGETGRLELFPFGLAAFLLAHLNFIAGFRASGTTLATTALSALLVLPVAVPIGTFVVRALVVRGEEALRVPVIVYMAVLGAMTASAVATGSVVAAIGAWLFLASDAVLAWDRFVRTIRWAHVIVAVTYHAAQAALVVSLVR
jgi:uncharacterized membrane protein YhhN